MQRKLSLQHVHETSTVKTLKNVTLLIYNLKLTFFSFNHSGRLCWVAHWFFFFIWCYLSYYLPNGYWLGLTDPTNVSCSLDSKTANKCKLLPSIKIFAITILCCFFVAKKHCHNNLTIIECFSSEFKLSPADDWQRPATGRVPIGARDVTGQNDSRIRKLYELQPQW